MKNVNYLLKNPHLYSNSTNIYKKAYFKQKFNFQFIRWIECASKRSFPWLTPMFSILAFTNEKKSNIFNEETMNFFISLMFPIFSALQKCINLKFTIYFSFITTFSIRKCSWCFVICRNIMIDLKDAFEKLILMSYIKNSFEELKNRTKTKKNFHPIF
jgi:hypothetical protein